MDREKERMLDVTREQIERKFGKGSLMKLGEHAAVMRVPAIPTGSLALDAALGIGGVPRGRIVEIYGPESSGKTTLALQIVAEAQRAGGVAAFIDAEHALDPAYASRLGVVHRRPAHQPAGHRRAGARDHATCSCAPAPSTSSSSTRSPRSCRAPSSRARWATSRSACRHAS